MNKSQNKNFLCRGFYNLYYFEIIIHKGKACRHTIGNVVRWFNTKLACASAWHEIYEIYACVKVGLIKWNEHEDRHLQLSRIRFYIYFLSDATRMTTLLYLLHDLGCWALKQSFYNTNTAGHYPQMKRLQRRPGTF